MEFAGKVALVTGGTSGIGLAAAKRLVAEGATVIITGRDGDRLRRAQQGLPGVAAVAADVSDPRDIECLMLRINDDYGRLDILVVNAGVSNAPPVGKLDPVAYAALMDVNCRGAVFTFVYAMPLLSAGAAAVFVGSVAGRKGQPGDALYAGSKGFIRAFTRSVGTDPDILARGIRVNSVAPGPTDTPLTADVVSNPQADAFVRQLVPMRRWGRAQEVADAILFLASDGSKFITGAEITVDGGMSHA